MTLSPSDLDRLEALARAAGGGLPHIPCEVLDELGRLRDEGDCSIEEFLTPERVLSLVAMARQAPRWESGAVPPPKGVPVVVLVEPPRGKPILPGDLRYAFHDGERWLAWDGASIEPGEQPLFWLRSTLPEPPR